ncbi:MAG TPA: hypothetical protein VFS02_03595 [Telluria sp.]|nr:hypothetical protein [Telluria sp.]
MHCLKQMAAGMMLVCAMGSAYAQLGNGGATYSDVMTSGDKSREMMGKFVAVTRDTLTAEATMLAAIGQAGDADLAMAQLKTVGPDMNVEASETVLAAQTKTGAALERGLAGKQVAFDAAGKRQFGDAMLVLAKSVHEYASLSSELPSLKQALKNSGNKARVSYYASKTVAGSLAEMRQTLRAAAAFARANGIALDATVEQALAQ